MKMRAEAGGGLEVEDGTYLVRLSAVEETDMDTSRWEKARGIIPAVRFHFELPGVPEADGEPGKLDARATAEKLTPRTKLWAWIEALTGCPLEPDTDLDLDALVGCEAMASILNEEDDNKIKWPRIKALVALPKGQSQGQPKGLPTRSPDPFDGFRKEGGDGVNWENFAAYFQNAGVTPAQLEAVIGEKPSSRAIGKWVVGESGRSLVGLVELAGKPSAPDPEDIPFE